MCLLFLLPLAMTSCGDDSDEPSNKTDFIGAWAMTKWEDYDGRAKKEFSDDNFMADIYLDDKTRLRVGCNSGKVDYRWLEYWEYDKDEKNISLVDPSYPASDRAAYSNYFIVELTKDKMITKRYWNGSEGAYTTFYFNKTDINKHPGLFEALLIDTKWSDGKHSISFGGGREKGFSLTNYCGNNKYNCAFRGNGGELCDITLQLLDPYSPAKTKLVVTGSSSDDVPNGNYKLTERHY